MKSLAGFILRGMSQAVLVISAAGLLAIAIPPFALLSGAAVALITLRNDSTSALKVVVLSGLVAAGFLWIVIGQPVLMLALLILWLPIMLASTVLRHTTNLALALLSVALIAAFIIAGVYISVPDPAIAWQRVLEQIFTGSAVSSDPQQLQDVIVSVSKYMTGAFAAGFMINVILCLLIGRWWQALLYNPGGFGQEFHGLRIGKALTVAAFCLTLIAMVVQAEWIVALLMVMFALYLFQGLAVAHAFFGKSSRSRVFLTVFYVLLIFIRPFLLVVSLFGMIDAWVDSRRRWLDRAPGA